MDSNCRYDLEGFANDLGLTIEEVADLFFDLINEMNSEIYKIKTFLKEKNLDELKRVNHNVKGISANYRILDIYEETQTISDALRQGDFQSIEAHFNTFFTVSEKAFKDITAYFKKKGSISDWVI